MSARGDLAPRFYFSLPRLLALFCGGDARRSENNPTEAWTAGLAFFLITYLFFSAEIVPRHFAAWTTAVLLVAIAFGVWVFWLALLLFNSIVVKLARSVGMFRSIPDRRAQSVLLGFTTTLMAWRLFQNGGWLHEIAAIWLTAVALNLVCALVLAFTNATRGSAQ